MHSYHSALVTGASSGIGAGFARILTPPTRLLLSGRDEARLRQTAAGLAVPDGRVSWLSADLASPEGRARVIGRADQSAIDLLVCNAGVGWSGDFLDAPLARAHDTVTVNIVAVLDLLHALLPGMIDRARHAQRRAAVIIVSSMGAFVQAPAGLACYAASKVFVLRLAEGLALECRGQPLDVLALCPGETATAFFDRAGLASPRKAMVPDEVARQALAAVGRRTVHLCSTRRYPQGLRQLAAFNPSLLDVWRLPRRMVHRLWRKGVRSG